MYVQQMLRNFKSREAYLTERNEPWQIKKLSQTNLLLWLDLDKSLLRWSYPLYFPCFLLLQVSCSSPLSIPPEFSEEDGQNIFNFTHRQWTYINFTRTPW